MAAYIIQVDKMDRDIVQRANIEAESTANLIAFMINNNVDISNERFLAYEEKYKTAFWAFETAKKDIEKKYLTGKNAIDWTLNYETCELTYNA